MQFPFLFCLLSRRSEVKGSISAKPKPKQFAARAGRMIEANVTVEVNVGYDIIVRVNITDAATFLKQATLFNDVSITECARWHAFCFLCNVRARALILIKGA
jgi:hypothetical protein